MPEITQVELFVDGGSRGNPGPAACAFVIREVEGRNIEAREFSAKPRIILRNIPVWCGGWRRPGSWEPGNFIFSATAS